MLAELEKLQWRKRAGLWSFGICLIILTFSGILARITLTLQGASVTNPDIAIFSLLKEDTVQNVDLLRDEGLVRHYIVETNHGTKLIILEKKEAWEIIKSENLRN
jgi:hypothetical protein